MTVVFSQQSLLQHFDTNSSDIHFKNNPTIFHTKLNDGPNLYSVLWNQILSLWFNKIIYDEISLRNRYDDSILLFYTNDLIHEINILIETLKHSKTIHLLYAKLKLIYSEDLIHELLQLKNIIYSTYLILNKKSYCQLNIIF